MRLEQLLLLFLGGRVLFGLQIQHRATGADHKQQHSHLLWEREQQKKKNPDGKNSKHVASPQLQRTLISYQVRGGHDAV